MKLKAKWITAFVMVTLLILNMVVPASASLTPDEIEVILQPGEEFNEEKCLDASVPQKIDIVFAFDLTGSMGGVINTAKAKSLQLMTDLSAELPDADFNFGVMSYMDYPHRYENYYGYTALYGDAFSGDYAYSLDQSITQNQTVVSDAINALVLGFGGDGPQDYTRIFYESYADDNVGWRDGAKRILINFGDNVPHDNNLNEDVPGTIGTYTTGGDPGRDEIMMNADDLDLQTVLAEMSAEGIILLEGHSNSSYIDHWTYWTGLTGGAVFLSTSGDFIENIIGEVESALATMEIVDLHLEAPGFESWLTSEWSYDGEVPEETLCGIDVKLTVPIGTEPGVYEFTIIAVDDYDVVYGEQFVRIKVPDEVLIDVKPGSDPNAINLAKDKGVLPVAILTTEYFDATLVNPETVVLSDGPFGSYTAEVYPVHWAVEDVDYDGDMDMIFHFSMEEIRDSFVIESGDEAVWVRCFTFDEMPFEGMDSILIVGKPL